MLSSINGNSSLQMISALNAFKGANAAGANDKAGMKQPEIDTSSGINLLDNNSLLEKIDLTEIKSFAQKIGETDLTDEDIKYGLTYGRSVIADYVA